MTQQPLDELSVNKTAAQAGDCRRADDHAKLALEAIPQIAQLLKDLQALTENPQS